MKKNIIPKNIANGCPDKCPICLKKCIAVFRTWKPTNRVSCEFAHANGKTCKKTYDNN
jgi:hypothetical protein